MILRELFVKLGLDVDAASFAEGFTAAEALTKVFEKVAEAVVENIKAAIEYGDVINKTAQKIGIATDALQELQYAATLSDVSAETMSTSIGILSRKMLEAKNGGEAAAKAFKGISFMDGGKLKNADDVLGDIADQFAAMPDGAEKTARAMELFGRGGKEMIPLLNKGRAELAGIRQEAEDMGLVMSKDALEASEELNDNLKRISETTKGLWRQAIGPLIPLMNELAKRFLEWRKSNAAILKQNMEKYVTVLRAAIIFLADSAKTIWSVFQGVIGFFKEIWNIGPGVKASILAIGAAFLVAFAPVAAIVAGLTMLMLLFNSIHRWSQHKSSAFGRWMNDLDKAFGGEGKVTFENWWMIKFIRGLIDGIKEAVKWLNELWSEFSAMPLSGNPLMDWLGKKAVTKANELLGNKPANSTGAAAGIGAGIGSVFSAAVPSVSPQVGSKGTTINAPLTMHVTQQPGEDSGKFANRIMDLFGGFWNGKMQEAAAGTGK